MASFGNGGQPRDAMALVQAMFNPAWLRRTPVLVLASLFGVSGCSNDPTTGPVAWWHHAEGGKIAEARLPPPGSNEPYPNLATVPAKPPAPNATEWTQRTAGLITDRIEADQLAALAPIPPVGPATTLPGMAPQAPATPAQQSAASAALVGVTSPPRNGSAPSAAPGQMAKTQPATNARGSVQAVAPGSSTAAGGNAGPATAGLSTAERVANGQLPPLPGEVPARPGIAPPPPPPLVPATVTPPQALAPTGAIIDFSDNSAALNDPALAEVKALAADRGDYGIAITGYGGATSSDPVVQSAALSLGLSRAQALATALVAQGVPYAMLRLNAEAAGRGATLRLLQ